ncbi:MAG TPA: DUF1573 domain-containing protein [Bacteroidia bacterium]|nr:DUF1573 domain-containing protein [Bacteroidia bacterium]HNT79483.1 DUF1573 domain-containing protein [Bacteroidia bacterium]
MKRLILVSFLIVGFGINSLQAQDQRTTPNAVKASSTAPEFKFVSEEYNFGTIKQGDVVTHEYSFTNVGKEPIIITDARGSCGCTVPVWPKEPIKSGESGTIKISFNSAGKLGMQDKTVTISSNATNNPVILHVKGNIVKAEETK